MFRADEMREGRMNLRYHRSHQLQQQEGFNPFSDSGQLLFSGNFADRSRFEASMHQSMMDSGGPSMGYSERVLDVGLTGLSESFLRMNVGDPPSSSNGRVRVDPDAFMPGFSDPVRVWDRGWDVSDSVGPTRFPAGINSSGIWSQGAARQGAPLMLNDVERPFVGGGGFENGGSRNLDMDVLNRMSMVRQRPFVDDGIFENGGGSSLEMHSLNRMNMLTQRPFVGDGFIQNGGGGSSLEMISLNRMNMVTQRPFVGVDGPFPSGVLENGGLSLLELELLSRLQLLRQMAPDLRPMIPNPLLPQMPLQLQLPVEALNTDGSFVLDAAGQGGQCSKCSSEMKPKTKRSKAKKRRNDQSVIPPRMISDGDLLLGDSTALQGANGAGRRLVDFQGNLYRLCKDQQGCRFLQNAIEGGNLRDVDLVFTELIDHVAELMVDPFANYLIQKLLEVCTEEHRMAVVYVVTRMPGELFSISIDPHGTRVVQKLVELIKCRKHISMIIFSLKPHLIELIKDLHGNHVVQTCLENLGSEHTKFIYDTATRFCVDIATHQHGCCVLNRCIAYSGGSFREKLVANICANGLLLAQDSFGNYVIQYIIELKYPPAGACLLSQFTGRFAYLSMQKFSSHVVEKCLRFIQASHPSIVQDLMSFPNFDQLLQDRFANYVIQSALEVLKGSLRYKLVERIRPYEGLRSSPFCKKIFSLMKK